MNNAKKEADKRYLYKNTVSERTAIQKEYKR